MTCGVLVGEYYLLINYQRHICKVDVSDSGKKWLGIMAEDTGTSFFTVPFAENIWSMCGE